MISYQLDPSTNDLFLRNGTIATVETSEETAQDIKTKLKTIQGEVFYNVLLGVPYFQVIFSKPFDKDFADTLILQTIYSSINVASVTNFQSRVDTMMRKYYVNFTVLYANNENNQFSNTSEINQALNINEVFTI